MEKDILYKWQPDNPNIRLNTYKFKKLVCGNRSPIWQEDIGITNIYIINDTPTEYIK